MLCDAMLGGDVLASRGCDGRNTLRRDIRGGTLKGGEVETVKGEKTEGRGGKEKEGKGMRERGIDKKEGTARREWLKEDKLKFGHLESFAMCFY